MPVPSDLGEVAEMVIRSGSGIAVRGASMREPRDYIPAGESKTEVEQAREQKGHYRKGATFSGAVAPDFIPSADQTNAPKLNAAQRDAKRRAASQFARQVSRRRKVAGFAEEYEKARNRLPTMTVSQAVMQIETLSPIMQEAWLLAEEDTKDRATLYREIRKPSAGMRERLNLKRE